MISKEANRYSIRFAVPENMDSMPWNEGVHIRSLVDVKPKGSRLHDRYLRLAMRLNKQNLLSWLLMKLAKSFFKGKSSNRKER